MINAETVCKDLNKIRQKKPLVHSITNYVVMNSTANALLSLGASPVMAHAEEEMEDMVSIANALVINIGTLSKKWIIAMHKAMEIASEKKIPIILDPVGAGATKYRTDTVHALINNISPSVIRGNASEIMAVHQAEGINTKGVDSTQSSQSALKAAEELAKKFGTVVSISGGTDFIVNNQIQVEVHNGNILMPLVTGLGCTASVITAAFCAVNEDYLSASAHAMALMGICGELAAQRSEGPGSMQMHFIDALYNIDNEMIKKSLKLRS